VPFTQQTRVRDGQVIAIDEHFFKNYNNNIIEPEVQVFVNVNQELPS